MAESRRHLVVYHTREIDRNIARRNIRDRGFTQINKDKSKDNKTGSFFANNWRKYVY